MTPGTLAAATGCTTAAAARFAGPLAEACALYEVNSVERLAAFLAQIGHESGALRWVREIWGPTEAQRRYEGRTALGNTTPGDGFKFRGHGLIQTTGRANHARVRDRLRARLGGDVPDFEATPEALEQPRWAALSAADYWDEHGLNALADAGEFVAIGRAINRGDARSPFPANGEADRLKRWEKAKAVLLFADDVAADATPKTAPPLPESETMPIPAIVAALLPSLIEAVPKLGKLFGSGSAVAERNVKAAELAMQIAQDALGAKSAQEAVETAQADPQAAQVVREAIEQRWLELTEAGGDGIAGARKADASARDAGDMLRSPSFWFMLTAMPLVYMVVGSVVGLWGGAWPSDVRAAIATAVVSLIVGGAAGYYWGQTTSRNRTPPAAQTGAL